MIGCYTCSSNIGEFTFAGGPLYHCMETGKMLILENFQEANDEVVYGIVDIIQKNQICLNNQSITGKLGFKILILSNFHDKKKS